MYKILLSVSLTLPGCKLDRLFLVSLSSLVYCLWARPGAYPRVDHLKGVSLGQAAALPVNTILSWKGVQGTNTLAYSKLCNLRSYKVLQHWPQVPMSEIFLSLSLTLQDCKLEHLLITSLSSLVYCLRARQGVYPRVDHLKGVSFEQVPAVPVNTALSWKGLQRTNTLAYSKICNLRSYKVLQHWHMCQCQKSFLTLLAYKLECLFQQVFPALSNICG